MMRAILVLTAAAGLLTAIASHRPQADEPGPPTPSPRGDGFREVVRPFLESYCLGCHGGDEPEAGLDLSGFSTASGVLDELPLWEIVQLQLEDGAMPPPGADRHPAPEARSAVVAWIGDLRRAEADRAAGDPGPVPTRRLSNAEYDHTIRDLTGVDIRPARDFPVDPANEAGFDNSAESLRMSPALVRKYIDAARAVADHLVLTPSGLGFAPHPAVAETDRDKYCVNRIIAFYDRQPTDLADYFLAAWRYRHRSALGLPDASPADLAAGLGISPSYLEMIRELLDGPPEDFGPVAAVRALWEGLPGPGPGELDAARAGCERLRDFVINLRRQLTPEVENLTAGGINPGSQPFVLRKNRQMAENRRRYAGGAAAIRPTGLDPGGAAERALAPPSDPGDIERFEATFDRFCSTFPDTFFVSERARVYLDPEQDRDNTGRLLSAGFHSMTGYFRDDGPLYELLLDDAGRRELDRLWDEFDFIADGPARQYASYLWFERAESGFMRDDPAFDFVRAEDRDASSEAKMGRLAEAYLAKARRIGAGEEALRAIEDQFRIIAESIRRVERQRVEAEPRHVEALQDFAERASRRPLPDAERDGVADFYRQLRERDGLAHEDAVRDTIAAILMSPHFLYRVDLAGEGDGDGIRPLSSYDLASRLSYFLWASMPDGELLSMASSGDLADPGVLASQARRMLRDPRVRGLATEFGGHWLDVRRFEEHNGVDRGRFPTFDDELRRSMFEEPIRFFVDLARDDLPISAFLSGRHTFVNPSLARHYGMPEPEGGPDDWARVDDATPFGRGGLLPMAVFQTANSPGLRTSPVKRGYWVVRRLLGEHIPPPPPDVPDLPDAEADLGALTLREALARHRADPSCAGCHDRFDGIGLAFEGFGPVGELREVDLGGRPVETLAAFPGGVEGDGVEGLRAYLEEARRDEFIENFCRKFLSYALGRTLLPSDDATVTAMIGRVGQDGGRMSDLVEEIVLSPQFRNKRVERGLSE
jgi:mono/diheme cytochrome c family protein